MMAAIEALDASIPLAKRTRAPLDRRLIVGGTGLAVIVLAALFAPLLAPFDPIVQHLDSRLQGPSGTFLLGTDNLGRDTLSRLLYGLRPSLVSGLAAVAIAAVVGTSLGLLAGYFGRWLDAVLSRMLDLLIAWPMIFLALALVLLLGPGPFGVVLAIALAEVPIFARVMRAITLSSVRGEHVEAARSMGASGVRIMRRHIFPFAVSPLLVQFAIAAPLAVVAEASLSYLGLGTQPPTPSLGSILSDAELYLSQSYSAAVFPVLTIALLVLCLTLIADGLQKMLDPRGGNL
ncbi:ABC transporter permease [Pseudonocardia kunmingensis]|uniref:Peptide/nickel transport system permease protein n=1 Tax=Pseudonocardia kunmingensis TaxID=630975 RepID=A0A543CX09_9PSEU|nr:ABC transporter permease [Pseudonocardia kunmingensis]TQM01646.1 peptide/nickel transport system permease protein [Pseudonocardia kunmingensis]